MKKTRTTFLLNWYANPYHTPIFVAKSLGYYQQEGIQLAILETTDPSDVTEIIGTGAVDFGLKAMIHTLVARVSAYPVLSIGTLLDEPPTGLISLKSSGISAFHDIVGKRIGYIGEFGKRIIDDLARLAGIDSRSYQSIRVGMNVTDAIRRNVIDAGIGFTHFQLLELEMLVGEAQILRLDQLAGLGCCCFCSIQYITREDHLKKDPEKAAAFMRATRRGVDYTTQFPEEAFDILCRSKPQLNNEMYKKIFIRTLPLFSRTLMNVEKDWGKVGQYAKHLDIVPPSFDVSSCYTNQFVPLAPHSETKPLLVV